MSEKRTYVSMSTAKIQINVRKTYLRKYAHREDSDQCQKTYLRKYGHSEDSDQCQKNVPT